MKEITVSKVKPFFINSNIHLKKFSYKTVEDILTPLGGNTGNSYITYGLMKAVLGGICDIPHIQNIYTYDFSKSDKDIEIINNECTHVFFILQDQIRLFESYSLTLPYTNIINFLKRLNKKVIVAGLGANCFSGFDKEFYKKLNPELVEFLRKLSEYCELIGLRGEFTQEVMSKLGISNTEVIGCPSYFENGRDRIVHKKPFGELNIMQSSKNFTRSINNYHTVLQDFNERDIIARLTLEDYTAPLQRKDEEKLCEDKFHVFADIESWKNFVSQFDFMFGYRLHGSILALNSGAVALCCNHDSRATEMCNFLKIPHYTQLDDKKTIQEYYEMADVDALNRAYPALFDNYKQFLNKNNIELFEDNPQPYEYIKQPVLPLFSHKQQ